MNSTNRLAVLHIALCAYLLGSVIQAATAGQLHDVVESGDSSQIRALVVTGLDINELNSSGMAALHLALLEGKTDMVEILISNGADVNIPVQSGLAENRFYAHLHTFAPLHLVANFHHTARESNSLELASLLIASGADVNQRAEDGQSSLHLAVRNGNDSLATLLIDHGADVNARDLEEYTPLHSAAWNGHLGLVEVLISNGANVSASAYDGVTPYNCAVKKKRTEVIAFMQNLGIVQ